jgi:hypothetical protein
MKKGQIIGLEMLVKFLPHLIVAIVVFAVFVMLVNSFITKETTPEIEDFERINSEFKALLEAPYPGVPISITVPVQRDSNLNMIVYSSETSPAECRKNTCICLMPKGQDKPICNIYPEIKNNCGSTCSTICVTQSYRPERNSQTSVTITRNCNEITIS